MLHLNICIVFRLAGAKPQTANNASQIFSITENSWFLVEIRSNSSIKSNGRPASHLTGVGSVCVAVQFILRAFHRRANRSILPNRSVKGTSRANLNCSLTSSSSSSATHLDASALHIPMWMTAQHVHGPHLLWQALGGFAQNGMSIPAH